MKNSILLIIFVFFIAISCTAQESENTSGDAATPKLMDAKTSEEIEMEQLVGDLSRHDVIFLGEQHDNDSGHQFQLDLIQALVDQGLDVAISMEQFERDVQGALDDFLADRITEEQFLSSARPWTNYREHYRPIIELAKKNRIPVLAANIPSELARMAAKGSTFKAEDKAFLPRSTSAPKDAYWQNFQEAMKGHGGTGDSEKLGHFYAAQCLKDDAMAEAITDYLARNSHRPKIVVHLCGHFHSDFGLGTVARVAQRSPLTRIAVVTMETLTDGAKLDEQDARSRGHYVFWTVKNRPSSEPSEDEPANGEKSEADEE